MASSDIVATPSSSPLAVVTGASGFIGANLVETLAARGMRVRCLVRSAGGNVLGGAIERLTVDYRDPKTLAQSLAGADYVFHLAGVTKALSLEQFRAGNVLPTRNLIAALAAIGATPRFLFVSSQAASGPAASRQAPRREEDAPSPTEGYGRTKLEAEQVVAREYGGAWTVVRPAAVYGPHDRDFLAVFKQARFGFGVYAGSRARWVSIVHVRDLVDGIIRAATMPIATGRTYFLTHAAPATWQDIYRAAARAAGAELRAELDVPQPVVDALGWVGDAVARVTGRVGLLNTQKVALGRAEYWLCSGDRAQRELGFSARVPLEGGMRETHRWYRERGWL